MEKSKFIERNGKNEEKTIECVENIDYICGSFPCGLLCFYCKKSVSIWKN